MRSGRAALWRRGSGPAAIFLAVVVVAIIAGCAPARDQTTGAPAAWTAEAPRDITTLNRLFATDASGAPTGPEIASPPLLHWIQRADHLQEALVRTFIGPTTIFKARSEVGPVVILITHDDFPTAESAADITVRTLGNPSLTYRYLVRASDVVAVLDWAGSHRGARDKPAATGQDQP